MDLQALTEQAAGILVRERLLFQTHSDGDSYRLLFGRDAVFLHFDCWLGRPCVQVTSPVLQRLDPEDAGHAVLLNRLNELNTESPFVKWTVLDDKLIAGCDLLGERMQAVELRHAIDAVREAAVRVGDELELVTGGVRYEEILAEYESVEDD